ncbi:MAG: Glu-tRNA(Gln) amidotransferase subunit GatD [Candidatus Micrarchaeia archaeon]
MYKGTAKARFDASGIEAGDTIRVSKASQQYTGILMPRPGIGDPSCAILKLKTGYNIGIEITKETLIELVSKGEPAKIPDAQAASPAEAAPAAGFVSFIGCGGTIASKIDYRLGAVNPAITAGELVSSFPEVARITPIRSKMLFSVFSEDMNAYHWQQIAYDIEDQVKDGAEGIVLMHGTDTMGYSAAAISLMVQNPQVPIVFVGAQRSSDRGSSDNRVNVMCATRAAKSDIANVSLCMHGSSSDDYCYLLPGTNVRKMHTSRRDAFQSINRPPLARIDYPSGRISQVSQYARTRKQNAGMMKIAPDMNQNVALVYTYPGIKPDIFNSLSNYDGVVIAGTGLGHVPTNANSDPYSTSVMSAIKSLVDSNVIVAMAPQTIFGRINMNIYTAGRMLLDIGVIGNGCDWTPDMAFVKLMWSLGQVRGHAKAKALMLENVAGEISERIELEQ